jgi:hypothetical protein
MEMSKIFAALAVLACLGAAESEAAAQTGQWQNTTQSGQFGHPPSAYTTNTVPPRTYAPTPPPYTDNSTPVCYTNTATCDSMYPNGWRWNR